MDFLFENGADLIIRVDGGVLGGVTHFKRTVKNDADNIYQFLTDKPVVSIPRHKYKLEFKLRCSGGCVFDNEIHTITVSGGDKTEAYTNCVVKECVCTAHHEDALEYSAVVEAEERSAACE